MHNEYLFTLLSEHFACVHYSGLGFRVLSRRQMRFLCVLFDLSFLESDKYRSYTGFLNLILNGKVSRI